MRQIAVQCGVIKIFVINSVYTIFSIQFTKTRKLEKVNYTIISEIQVKSFSNIQYKYINFHNTFVRHKT